MIRYFTLCFVTLFLSLSSQANNLQIGAVTVSTTGGNQYLNFSISWDNSWRMLSNPGNWDAVWVFVKRRDCAALDWSHVNLSDIDTDHSAGSPLFVDAYPDKKGVMIYRTADGSGNISAVNIQLKLDAPPAGNYEYSVFGIEMVYIPQGAFYVGDGVSYSSLQKWPTTEPYLISSENSIQIGQDTGKLFYLNSPTSDVGIVDGTTLSAAYPKGYNSFYCMKYEVSQGQYADFLNNIAQDAAANRYNAGNSNLARYTIHGIWPAISSSTPDRACSFMTFQDLAALLDWSALSPMTELEYEKVCRGAGNSSIAGEMAWGSNTATDAHTIAAGTDGTPAEYITDSITIGSGPANFAGDPFDTIAGPLRCGFAARSNTNRFRSGATYYGVMEMSGNVQERCYNLAIYTGGSLGGGLFTGGEGDGELTTTPNAGYANEGWIYEGYNGGVFQEGYAVGLKGGGSVRALERLAISDRYFIANTNASTMQLRYQDYGGRGVSRRQ